MSTSPVRVVVTGIGLVSAAGSDVAALCDTLRAGQACLQPISSFDTAGMTMTHAGEVPDFDPAAILPPVRVRSLDRATQMALSAARQALAQAGRGRQSLDLHKTGVAIGVSGAHQYQNMPVTADRKYPISRRTSLYFSRSTPIFQADFLADSFYLCGPRFAFGSASLGGLLAVAHASDLLRNGHAAAMLVGGAEILTMVNALGMDVLGLGANGPCAPFYASNGMSFGEGAAFLVLETLDEAQRRDVQPLAEIIGSGVSGDAYHEISNDPAGQGLARAIDKALGNAGAKPGDIAWIRACGTGHKIQDLAERLAFEQIFEGALPPVTSTEPYFGHVNGVSPLLGLVAGIAAQQEGIAPSLPIEAEAETDRAPPLMASGPMPRGDWLLSAVAFGGSNGALVVGPVQARSAYRAPAASAAAIEIAGVGMVSGLGADCQAFITALREPAPAIRAACRIDERRSATLAGLDLRRRERIVRWSLIAVAQALADAQLVSRGSARIGLLMGLCRGPMTSYERFCDQVLQGNFNASTGRSLLKTGRFSVASEVVHAFDLRGYCVCGFHHDAEVLAMCCFSSVV